MKASVRVQRCVLPFGDKTVYAVAKPAAPIVTETQLTLGISKKRLTHIANHQVVIMLEAVIQTRQYTSLNQEHNAYL